MLLQLHFAFCLHALDTFDAYMIYNFKKKLYIKATIENLLLLFKFNF